MGVYITKILMIFQIFQDGKNQIMYSIQDGYKICYTKFSNLRIQDVIRRFPPLNIFSYVLLNY